MNVDMCWDLISLIWYRSQVYVFKLAKSMNITYFKQSLKCVFSGFKKMVCGKLTEKLVLHFNMYFPFRAFLEIKLQHKLTFRHLIESLTYMNWRHKGKQRKRIFKYKNIILSVALHIHFYQKPTVDGSFFSKTWL